MATFEEIQQLRANTTKLCIICSQPVSIYRVKDGVYSNKKRERQVCDSNACLQKFRQQRSMEKNGVLHPALLIRTFSNCVICGTRFHNTNKSKTCSKKCARILVQQTTQERFGVNNAMQSSVVQEKLRNSNIEKYGVPYPHVLESVRNKMKATMLARHGVKYPYQIHIPRVVLDTLDDKQKIEQYYIHEGKSLTQIGDILGVDYKTVGRYVLKHGFTIRHEYSTSLSEHQINDFVVSLDFETRMSVRNILPSGRELDIYIPSKQIAIEFNGLYWHSERVLVEFKKPPRTYHLDKTIAAESVGIQLIHIYEDDWLCKQDIVKTRLRNALGVTDNTVYARECNIAEIESKDTTNFLSKYHLQGSSESGVRLGLYHNDLLVACMTFGNFRIALGQTAKPGMYELLRFCSVGNVVGGASKLFTHFVSTYNPEQVISYADRDWTTAIKPNLYDRLGFTKVSDGKPSYWYVGNNKRTHRFNFRKSELPKKLAQFDPSLTEYQNMLIAGYDRIWGCGSFKYIWNSTR